MDKVLLYKNTKEKMIRQLVYIDENLRSLVDLALSSKSFSSIDKAQQFFLFYVKKVESLLNVAEITDDMKRRVNYLPFIIIGSYFVLRNEEGMQFTCRLTLDLEAKDRCFKVHLLSDAGLELIFRKISEIVDIDIGDGLHRYTICSIKI